jgi:molybdopterin/thiamine biosynthesis adenylyltransferase
LTLSVDEPADAGAFAVAFAAVRNELSLVPKNEIFSRERLAGYNPELMNASIAVLVGAGALGQNTALNLALAGIGEMRIVDHDSFETHNRTRSPAYPSADEQLIYGAGKARAVAAKFRRLMTASRPVMRYANKRIQELGDGAFQGASVIIACVDSQLARAYLSDKARQHELPFVEAGFEGEKLTLTSFPRTTAIEARSTPCWRCSHPSVYAAFSCQNYAAQAEAAGIIPAIQNAAATLGGLQAEAAVTALHCNGTEQSAARSFSLNVRTWEGYRTTLAVNRRCVGIHDPLGHEYMCLKTKASQPVQQLLTDISEQLGEPARIVLPFQTYSRLLWKAPCGNMACGQMTLIRSPEWRWIMNQRCADCGGPFPVMKPATRSSPDIYADLTLESNADVLAATCEEIGLPPLSLVAAIRAGSATTSYDRPNAFRLFQLPGTLDELYQQET